MMDKVAKDAAGDANASSIAQLTDAMAQNSDGACQQIIANRYPFAKSDRDVPMADFAQAVRAERRHRPVLLGQSRAARQSHRQDLGVAAQSQSDAQAVGHDLAPVPAGGRNPRRLFPDRRRPAQHHLRGEAADAERRGADRDAQRSTAPTVVAQQGGQRAGQRCNGRAPARAPPRSRWRPTCRTANRTSSAPAPGRSSASSTPAR